LQQRLLLQRCWLAVLRPLIRRLALESIEPADTIVVLGGMMNPPKGASVYPDLDMSADRLVLRCTTLPGWQIRPDHCHWRAVVRWCRGAQ
jgi:hypothetical protein